MVSADNILNHLCLKCMVDRNWFKDYHPCHQRGRTISVVVCRKRCNGQIVRMYIYQDHRNREGWGVDHLPTPPTYHHTTTDYRCPERKWPSLHGRKFNPNPKLLGTAAAYFVCHNGPIFQISLIFAFIGCP